MATKRQKKSKTGISLDEFRAWLQGIEDMQDGENWSPSPAQWLKIKQKIQNIEEDVEVVEVVAPATQIVPPVTPRTFAPTPPSSAFPGTERGIPFNSGGNSVHNVGANGAIRTPDIDSSQGYQSTLV